MKNIFVKFGEDCCTKKGIKLKLEEIFTNKIQGRSPQKFRKIHFPIDLRDKSSDWFTDSPRRFILKCVKSFVICLVEIEYLL
jgi:hypothetical protein